MSRGLDETVGLVAFAMHRVLEERWGSGWPDDERLRALVGTRSRIQLGDPQVVLKLILDAWNDGFREVFDSRPCSRAVVDDLRLIRNRLAHSERMPVSDAARAFMAMLAMLEAAASHELFHAGELDEAGRRTASRGCAVATSVGLLAAEAARRYFDFRHDGIVDSGPVYRDTGEPPTPAQVESLNRKRVAVPATKEKARIRIGVIFDSERLAITDKQAAFLRGRGVDPPLTKAVARAMIGALVAVDTTRGTGPTQVAVDDHDIPF